MSRKISVACFLVLAASVCAGCATSDPYYATSNPYYPSAAPGWVGPTVTTDAPSIENADAAGLASVPGVHTGAAAPAVIVPAPPAASPVIVVPPAR